jgi:hypothetical protein
VSRDLTPSLVAVTAAMTILTVTMAMAIDLLFAWSARERVLGRHVMGVMLLVLLLTWRIATRVLTGTM